MFQFAERKSFASAQQHQDHIDHIMGYVRAQVEIAYFGEKLDKDHITIDVANGNLRITGQRIGDLGGDALHVSGLIRSIEG